MTASVVARKSQPVVRPSPNTAFRNSTPRARDTGPGGRTQSPSVVATGAASAAVVAAIVVAAAAAAAAVAAVVVAVAIVGVAAVGATAAVAVAVVVVVVLTRPLVSLRY